MILTLKYQKNIYKFTVKMPLPHILYLRNQLWCEIFYVLGTILDNDDVLSSSPFNVLWSILEEIGHTFFLKTIRESVASDDYPGTYTYTCFYHN